MIAVVFPGQGSQKKGMGKGLFEAFPQWTALASDLLGYAVDELCLEDPEGLLGQTAYTQPALFVVNALTWYQKRAAGLTPSWLAGHSLGEYNALLAAEVFDFETGLRLVQRRGGLMAQATEGGMAAVVGLEEQTIRNLLAEQAAVDVDIANLNTPSQVVLAGPKETIVRLEEVFKQVGARMYSVLRVSAAFHSRYMQPAREAFEAYLHDFDFHPPALPVIANLTARPYQPDQVAATLAQQIDHPVKWSETIRYLMGQGVEEFVESGHGRVLAGLLRKIRQEAEPLILGDETPLENASSHQTGSLFDSGSNSVSPEEDGQPAEVGARVTAPERSGSTMARENSAGNYAPLPSCSAETLGSRAFRETHGLTLACVAGSLPLGISSPPFLQSLADRGLLGFYGCEGLSLDEIERDLDELQEKPGCQALAGASLPYDPDRPGQEGAIAQKLLARGISRIEVAHQEISPTLVWCAWKGGHRGEDGRIKRAQRLFARVSRPEIAAAFMEPAPEAMVDSLVADGLLTSGEAELARTAPICSDIVVQADRGGATDMGNGFTLLPSLLRLRDQMVRERGYEEPIFMGFSGGLGTPEAVAAAFFLGADFVVTGSINQATAEARTSPAVKDLLAGAGVRDTSYVPDQRHFELGSQAQVLKKGSLFAARALKLGDIYRQVDGLENLDSATLTKLEEQFFLEKLSELWHRIAPARSCNGKQQMALMFKWYLYQSKRWAVTGNPSRHLDFQIPCGPSMGALNQWLEEHQLESWRTRSPADLAYALMEGAHQFGKTTLRVFV